MKQLSFEKENLNKIDLLVIIICLLIAFFFLLIATKSSPLYPFNDWADANISFTMGKGMMNGKIPYRDLFDHKGPLFYIIFGLAYLISNETFLCVFIFEVLSFSIFLFFSFKLINLYLKTKYAIITLPILAASIVNLSNFTHGGSVEQFCLPLLTISLYHLFDYFENSYPYPISNKIVLINGVIAGCILWIKFSLLGFWFGWIAAIFIGMFAKQEVVRAIKAMFVFLLGILIATLPWLIYFGSNHAIFDLLNAYFMFNIRSYSMDFSMISILKSTFVGILASLPENPVSIGLMYFGMIIFLTYKKFTNNIFLKLGLSLCFFSLALSVYGGGRQYVYYFLIFSPFIFLGFIAIFNIVIDEIGKLKSNRLFFIILFITLFVTFSYTRLFHHNTYMIGVKKEDLVQYKYAAIINQIESPSLLNYGGLDHGFYTTTGIVPNIRFFHYPNIAYSRYPIILDEQNRYIKEQVVDYVVFQVPTDYSGDFKIPLLDENYHLIGREKQKNEDNEFYYFLYKKNPD